MNELHRRLSLLADDEKTYMNLRVEDIMTHLGCDTQELSSALLETLTPTPLEVRENALLDLHAQGLACHQIVEATGMDEATVLDLAHDLGVILTVSMYQDQEESQPEEDQPVQTISYPHVGCGGATASHRIMPHRRESFVSRSLCGRRAATIRHCVSKF